MAVTEFQGESSVSSSQPITRVRQAELTEFLADLSEFGAELSEFLLSR